MFERFLYVFLFGFKNQLVFCHAGLATQKPQGREGTDGAQDRPLQVQARPLHPVAHPRTIRNVPERNNEPSWS